MDKDRQNMTTDSWKWSKKNRRITTDCCSKETQQQKLDAKGSQTFATWLNRDANDPEKSCPLDGVCYKKSANGAHSFNYCATHIWH